MIRKLLLVMLLLVAPSWAQLDFHETFEGGVCAETWTDGCPATLTNAATMTGDWYLGGLNTGTHDGEQGLNAASMHMEIQFRLDVAPTVNSFFFLYRDSADALLCGYFVDSDGTSLRIDPGPNASVDTGADLAIDTNYTLEMFYDNSDDSCDIRVNGGSWLTATGNSANNIDRWQINRGQNVGDNDYDEIKRCAAGEVSTCETDAVPPTPGTGVTISGATNSSLDVSVTAGTDDVTAQANLQYEFRRSLSANMDSVANAEANGTIVRAYTANDVTHTDTGLTSGVIYYYQVILKDEAGNKAIYTTTKEAPLIFGEAGVTHCRKCPGMYRIPEQVLPNGQESEVYPNTPLIALGGAEPRTWALNGTLPTGLSLSSAGVISGTVGAGTAGTYNFKVTVTEAGGGKAKGDLSLVVDIAAGGGGALAFYEDTEDTNISEFLTAGGCAATNTGTLEGAWEVTKSTATDCVLFDNVDKSQVYFGLDILDTLPATARDEIIIGLGASDEELFSCRYEADGDLFCKTPGQTENSNRGHHMGYTPDVSGSSAYLECRYIAGTGANATFECRLNDGAIKTFSAGTATANVDRIILRDDNDAAGDFVYDRIEAKDNDWPGRGPLTPVDPPPDPGEPGPWVTDFTPLRTHYVTPSGSGTQDGSIGNPESFATAVSSSHYQCGDLHHFRGGVYLNGGDSLLLPDTCNQSAPAVFKGYVDPATGQPENVEWKFGVESAGRWTWFVNIHRHNIGVSPTGETGGFVMRLGGVRVINSIVHDMPGSPISPFRSAGNPVEPGQVLYGNITYRAGPGVNGAHNYYTQNDYDAQGYKYFVQNISIEPYGNGGRRIFQANDSNGDRGLSGYWLEKNFFGDGNPVTNPTTNDGHTVIWTQGITGTGNKEVIFKDNVMADFFHSSSYRASVRMGSGAPVQFVFTGNYFARANIAPEGYWGNSGTHPTTIFTGNEIYDPPNGIHVFLFQTRGLSGALGSHKIPDADDWDDNVYGGTAQFQLFANGTNSGTLSLANWRTATDAARVTPASAVGFDINSTNPANPTTDKVVVTVNEYQCPVGCPFTDSAWGNIYCVNWDGNSTCSADISSAVGVGKDYTIRYPRDFFGTPAASGTCPASGACNVSLPTKRTDAEASGRFANAYVITAQP